MSNNRTEGFIQVIGNSALEINVALQQIQQRLDHAKGLSGRILRYDRMRVDPATADEDALTKGASDDTFVTLGTVQTITAQKTFDTVAIRVIDGNDQLIHAFGTTT